MHIVFSEHEQVYLKDIINGIQFDKKRIIISDSIIYRKDKIGELPRICDIRYLWKLGSECSVVNAIIKICPEFYEDVHINTYEDFCNSSYDMLILIYDYSFYEIYTKNELDIFRIIKNVDRMNTIEISIKTDSTDMRKIMII